MKLVFKKNPKNPQTKPLKIKETKTPKKQWQIKKGEKKPQTNKKPPTTKAKTDSISILMSWHEENYFKKFLLRDSPNWKLFYKVREYNQV